MKTIPKTALISCIALFASGLELTQTQAADAEKEVKQVIRQYYRAMAARDVDTLHVVLHETLLVIEAGPDNGTVHIVDTRKDELLPPEGNDDWDNLVISNLKVTISGWSRSVAMASFALTHPVGPKTRGFIQESLESMEEGATREATEKLLSEGARTEQHAMLVRQEGRWRIVSISVPK